MENEIKNFEDLKIWQEGVDLAVTTYSLFKDSKDWGFRDQIQRSSVSIPSNIAEGFDRNSNNEFIRFLNISKGSCGELRTQLIIAERVGLIENAGDLIEQTRKESKMIQKMITYRESLRI
ncbi:MAG: four helix bundle protein [Salinivirgaceae bacterium]